jgi:hypothetical protein
MRSLIEKQLSDIPPVIITIYSPKSNQESLCIQVKDIGGGFPWKEKDHPFHYYYSTAPASVPTYTYL